MSEVISSRPADVISTLAAGTGEAARPARRSWFEFGRPLPLEARLGLGLKAWVSFFLAWQMLAVSWTYLVIAEIVAATDGIGAMMMLKKTALLGDGMYMSGSFLEKKPELAKLTLKAYFAAVKFWKENPAEANAIMAKGLGFKYEDVVTVVGKDGSATDGGIYPFNREEAGVDLAPFKALKASGF